MKKTKRLLFSIFLVSILCLFCTACVREKERVKSPIEKIFFGMSMEEVIDVLGEPDEEIKSDKHEIALRYTHGIETLMGESDDLILFILHDRAGAAKSEYGLYYVKCRIPDIGLAELDNKVNSLYGSWAEIQHDEEKELIPEKREKGYLKYDYLYENNKIINLDNKDQSRLTAALSALYAENAEDPENRLNGLADRSLRTITAEGSKDGKGVVLSVDAFYACILQNSEK